MVNRFSLLQSVTHAGQMMVQNNVYNLQDGNQIFFVTPAGHMMVQHNVYNLQDGNQIFFVTKCHVCLVKGWYNITYITYKMVNRFSLLQRM